MTERQIEEVPLKTLKALAPGLIALVLLCCRSGGGAWEPIVIDMSGATTPSPTATPTHAALFPATTPAPAASPAPAAAPSPVPTTPSTAAAAAPPPTPGAESALAPARTPESVVGSRIEAYNRRDLEALAALFAADARVFDPPDRLRDSGLDQIRQTYARRFSSAPRSKLSASGRMAEGNFVVERETESGADGPSQSAIVVSEVRDGKIVRVWIMR